jgi:hypothetical protein
MRISACTSAERQTLLGLESDLGTLTSVFHLQKTFLFYLPRQCSEHIILDMQRDLWSSVSQSFNKRRGWMLSLLVHVGEEGRGSELQHCLFSSLWRLWHGPYWIRRLDRTGLWWVRHAELLGLKHFIPPASLKVNIGIVFVTLCSIFEIGLCCQASVERIPFPNNKEETKTVWH